MKALTTLLILISITLKAAVTVGLSPGFGSCDYLTLQEAIDSGESEIRVLNNSSFTETLTIDRSVEIRGGYSSCLTAQLNITNNINSIIRANDSPIRGIITDSPVIEIQDSIEALPIVKLYDLTLKDAVLFNESDGGRGIDISDSNVNLQLYRVLITNNQANKGAGIYIDDPENVIVEILDSSISGNTANMDGGGIYCGNTFTNILVLNNSKISDNQAENGGGVYATSGCNLILDCQTFDGKCPIISNNTANQLGGGLYAGLNAKVAINRSKIYSNKANISTFSYVTNNGTNLKLNNNYIYSNGSNGSENNDNYLMTSVDGANIEIKHTTIADNDVNDFSAILGIFSDAKIALYNSIIHNSDDVLINTTANENFVISCAVVNETNTVSGIGIQVFDPDFVDRENHDYHLDFLSQAIDYCEQINTNEAPMLHDIDGEDRPWDDERIVNFFGIADAGADESYINDKIFKNGFE